MEVQDSDLIGTLDIVGMFPNIPVAKTLEVMREELENDETFCQGGRNGKLMTL